MFLALSALSALALTAFGLHWAGLPDWTRHPASISAATLIIGFWVATHQARWYLLPLMRRPQHRPPEADLRVGVATTFVPGAESLEMLERTVAALVGMRVPHDTWVLDEGDDPRVRALCQRLGARHFSRRDRPGYRTEQGRFQAGTKHGNYNAWLEEEGYARYDIVVGFDPDHVPDADFLVRTLGQFRDPRIGYVQAPQVYYNQAASLIARGAAEETYAYYSQTQMALHGAGCPMVTGCHNLHRVEALRGVGGLPAHDADDLLITLLYGYEGWRGAYVPEILAEGLTPAAWPGYLKQQRRWARSVADVKLRAFPKMVGGLPVAERILNGLHGLYFLQGVVMFLVVALAAALLLTGARPAFLGWETLAWGLPAFAVLKAADYYRQRYFLDPETEGGVHWRSLVLKLAKWPYLGLALMEVVAGRTRPYETTQKTALATAERPLLRPHASIIALLLSSLAVGAALGHAPSPPVLVGALALVAVSAGLIGSEFLRWPAAYDAGWRPERIRPRSPQGAGARPALSPDAEATARDRERAGHPH